MVLKFRWKRTNRIAAWFRAAWTLQLSKCALCTWRTLQGKVSHWVWLFFLWFYTIRPTCKTIYKIIVKESLGNYAWHHCWTPNGPLHQVPSTQTSPSLVLCIPNELKGLQKSKEEDQGADCFIKGKFPTILLLNWILRFPYWVCTLYLQTWVCITDVLALLGP